MRERKLGRKFNIFISALLFIVWAVAYFGLPHMSKLDGPFDAEPFGFDSNGIPLLSRVELKWFGTTRYILESRENHGPAPGSVFVLKNPNGTIRWTRLGAPELGAIRLNKSSVKWFTPGGWVVSMKPEYTGAGEMYISPFGNFRFFFHRW